MLLRDRGGIFWLDTVDGLGRDSDPKWLTAAEGVVLLPTNEKARRELGWKPKCPTASSVIAKYVESHPGRLDRRLDVFFRLVELAGSRGRVPEEGKRLNARIHLQLTGAGGGDFALLLDEGRLRIARQATGEAAAFECVVGPRRKRCARHEADQPWSGPAPSPRLRWSAEALCEGGSRTLTTSRQSFALSVTGFFQPGRPQ